MEDWKLRESLKNRQKMNFFCSEKCQFFVKKCHIFQKKSPNIVRIFQNFALKMSIFRQKKSKIEINWNFSKNEFFALKTVEFCSKVSNFAGKKVKIFPKFVKNARKKLTFPIFFRETWIFSEKPKFFENLPFLAKQWIFFPKISKKLQFFFVKKSKKFCIFRKKEKKISKKP